MQYLWSLPRPDARRLHCAPTCRNRFLHYTNKQCLHCATACDFFWEKQCSSTRSVVCIRLQSGWQLVLSESTQHRLPPRPLTSVEGYIRIVSEDEAEVFPNPWRCPYTILKKETKQKKTIEVKQHEIVAFFKDSYKSSFQLRNWTVHSSVPSKPFTTLPKPFLFLEHKMRTMVIDCMFTLLPEDLRWRCLRAPRSVKLFSETREFSEGLYENTTPHM